MVTVNGHEAEPGCYIAGHHGQYGVDMLPDICEQFDVEFTRAERPAEWRRTADAESLDESYGPDGKRWGREDAYDMIDWAADELENRLNELTTGGYWSWEDGEFFLNATEVERWLFVSGTDYDDAWANVVAANVNEHCGYTDQYQATELAEDAGDGEQVYQFRITVHWEAP